MTTFETFYEITLWEGLITGVISTGMFATLLLKRSKLAFLVKLETLFVTAYVAMTLYYVAWLIFQYGGVPNPPPTWWIISEVTMLFVSQLC